MFFDDDVDPAEDEQMARIAQSELLKSKGFSTEEPVYRSKRNFPIANAIASLLYVTDRDLYPSVPIFFDHDVHQLTVTSVAISTPEFDDISFDAWIIEGFIRTSTAQDAEVQHIRCVTRTGDRLSDSIVLDAQEVRKPLPVSTERDALVQLIRQA